MKNSLPELCELAKGPKPQTNPQLRKLRQCRNKACRQKYIPRGIEPFCSLDCGVILAKEVIDKSLRVRAKLEQEERQVIRKQIKARKEKLKTRSDYLREAQSVFNKFIRERDIHQPCISCGEIQRMAWDAGHYRSTGAAPQLRFNEANCHRQCVPCNQHKSGNAIQYRKGLVGRIGLAAVEALEVDNAPAKWTIEDLKEIKATYRAKLKAMKESRCE